MMQQKIVMFALNPKSIEFANEQFKQLADENYEFADSEHFTDGGIVYVVYRFSRPYESPERKTTIEEMFNLSPSR